MISASGGQTEVPGRNTYAMPPTAQHLMTMKSTADSGAELEAYDSGGEKCCTIDLQFRIRPLSVFRCGEQSWQYN